MNILHRSLRLIGGTSILLYSLPRMPSFAEASNEQAKPNKSQKYSKGCRACTDFKVWASKLKKPSQLQPIAASTAPRSLSSASTLSTPKPQDDVTNTQEETTSNNTEIEWPKECPADRIELGISTWTFLHTMAEYYPENPTETQQVEMHQFMVTFSKVFPCEECAIHFREWMETHPPDVSSSLALSLWLCSYHNVVNEMLGKPVFPCDTLTQRWFDGWDDGSCDY